MSKNKNSLLISFIKKIPRSTNFSAKFENKKAIIVNTTTFFVKNIYNILHCNSVYSTFNL